MTHRPDAMGEIIAAVVPAVRLRVDDTHVVEREGDRLPEMRDRMRTGVSDRGYRIAAAFIERWAAHISPQPIDHDALAVLLIGGLINLRRSTWTFGAPPLGLDDDRILHTFLALSTTLLDIAPH